MSLRRRIAAAAALAVAAVALMLGIAGYLGTRAHLYSDLRQQLMQLAGPALQSHHDDGGFGPAGGGGAPSGQGPGPGQGAPAGGGGNAIVPPPQKGGGAPGYFQSVYPDGSVSPEQGGTEKLPVDAQVLAIARAANGRFYRDATVDGVHVEVLTIGDRYDGKAIEVALPLTSIDSVLHGLLLTYAILVGCGVVLAGILGLVIARTALAPIDQFVEHTEEITAAPDRSRRLEESGPEELRRLATSFNETLDGLERAVLAQRHLIADASHELRTPLAALRSNIQIFLEAERLPQEERAGLQAAIVSELDELTQLISDVLELARGAVPSGHNEELELDTLVREAVERARRREPQLVFDIELQPTVIAGAPHRIGRAITNLIENACKWSPPEGHVEVVLDQGVLVVRDHGPGFHAADLPHVFDRFYRAEAARRMPGSGLGLAIVKQAAEENGGWVTAGNAEDGGAVLRAAFGSPAQQPTAVEETAAP